MITFDADPVMQQGSFPHSVHVTVEVRRVGYPKTFQYNQRMCNLQLK